MSTHVSEQVTTGPVLPDRPAVPGVPSLRKPERPLWPLWALVAGIAVTTGIAIYLAVGLIVNSRSVPPDPAKKIAVPYVGSPVWQPLHAWVVQEDGRKKPFESFARETVRTITGREKFEGNDPVAVVFSWMMLYEPVQGDSNKASRAMDCNWEEYPFILCDHHELRAILFKEIREAEGKELTDEDRYGKYVSPSQLRNSGAVEQLLEQAGARRQREGNKAKLPVVESKAEEVTRRLKLYDTVRSGGTLDMPRSGAFNVVELDRYSKSWFSLHTVRVILNPPPKFPPDSKVIWAKLIDERRKTHPADYEEKLDQPIPAADLKKVQAAYVAVQKAYRSKDESKFASGSTAFLDTLAEVSREYHPDYPGTTTVARELWFNRVNPFQKAWIVGLLATFLLGGSIFVSGRWPVVGKVLYVAGLLGYLGALTWAGIGFFCRVSISGRPPVSNMYESIIWVSFMSAVFGLILELIYRKGVIALAGAVVSTFGFLLADQLPMLFTPNIQPLVAVLRSQYWLIIHVLTIVSSYAAFALAWGLGNFNLATIVLAPQRRDLIKTMSMFSYRAIQIGAILLFAGTMLGGAWAAESWGRFWGWDPKEVWALIAFLVYMIPLHARYVGWIKDFGLAAVSVCCFAFVVMAWYGVNFVLGAGLHSYGFGAGGNSWVYLMGLINIDLVFVAALSYLYGEQFREWRRNMVSKSAAPAAGV